MKITRLLLFLTTACLACQLSAQSFGGITVLSDNAVINGNSHADDGCAAGFDADMCITPPGPLNPSPVITALPTSVAARYCLTLSKQDGSCFQTTGHVATGFEYGGSNAELIAQWQVFANTMHLSQPFCANPYMAFGISDGDYQLEMEIPSGIHPPGTLVPLYYDYTGWFAAYSEHENVIEDPATATVTEFSINGVDMMQVGGFPTAFSSPPGNGNARHLTLSGWLAVPTSTPFTLVVKADVSATINAPAKCCNVDAACDLRQYDGNGASFFGQLSLSASGPIIPSFPPSGTPPALSFFSVDIGSASELSDPFASGTEYFDPADAYRIQGPLLPPGGANGTLDDGFYISTDNFPTPPDPVVPSLTAAPVGSGLPPGLVQSGFLNLDGLDRIDFLVQGLPAGQVPPLFPLPASECVYRPRHVYISFDDDSPGHYTDIFPSVPANSTYAFTGETYGSNATRDEVVELYVSSPILGGITTMLKLARETDIHQNLAPNPLPLGPDPQNDDLDALNFGYANTTCDNWYLSVDHQAIGTDATGISYDPGVIYRVSPALGVLVPAILPPDLGIPPGTDIDAFEFVRMYDPSVNPAGDILGVLFSVDVDDPLTPGIDESGGPAFDPHTIYISYMNGMNTVFDPDFSFPGNIDAISILPNSLGYSIPGGACNPYNFSNPPQGFNLNVVPNGVVFNWGAYPFANKCRLSGNKNTLPNDVSFVVNNANPPAFNQFFIPFSQLQSGETYRARVQCQCSANIKSPYTGYMFFTVPAQQDGGENGDFFENGFETIESEKPRVNVAAYPNPAADFVIVTADLLDDETVSVSIINTLGQEISAERIPAGTLQQGYRISTTHLSAGWYALRIMWGDHMETIALRVEK